MALLGESWQAVDATEYRSEGSLPDEDMGALRNHSGSREALTSIDPFLGLSTLGGASGDGVGRDVRKPFAAAEASDVFLGYRMMSEGVSDARTMGFAAASSARTTENVCRCSCVCLERRVELEGPLRVREVARGLAGDLRPQPPSTPRLVRDLPRSSSLQLQVLPRSQGSRHTSGPCVLRGRRIRKDQSHRSSEFPSSCSSAARISWNASAVIAMTHARNNESETSRSR